MQAGGAAYCGFIFSRAPYLQDLLCDGGIMHAAELAGVMPARVLDLRVDPHAAHANRSGTSHAACDLCSAACRVYLGSSMLINPEPCSCCRGGLCRLAYSQAEGMLIASAGLVWTALSRALLEAMPDHVSQDAQSASAPNATHLLAVFRG